MQNSEYGPLGIDIKNNPESPYWFLQLELPIDGKPTGVVLGHSDGEKQFSPDVNLTPFNGKVNGVHMRHVHFDPRLSRLIVFPDVTTLTYLNGRLLLPSGEYTFADGDVLQIGQISLLLTLIDQPNSSEKRARLATLAHANPLETNLPSIHELVQPIFVEEVQASYPAWIVARARELNESVGNPMAEALQIVLINTEAEKKCETGYRKCDVYYFSK